MTSRGSRLADHVLDSSLNYALCNSEEDVGVLGELMKILGLPVLLLVVTSCRSTEPKELSDAGSQAVSRPRASTSVEPRSNPSANAPSMDHFEIAIMTGKRLHPLAECVYLRAFKER